jgi:hypothetical protein
VVWPPSLQLFTSSLSSPASQASFEQLSALFSTLFMSLEKVPDFLSRNLVFDT